MFFSQRWRSSFSRCARIAYALARSMSSRVRGLFAAPGLCEEPGLPGPRWVATVEPSRFAEGRCYVAFDAHRSNDDEPYVYVTEDFGESWKSIRANLPIGSTRTLREDPKNPNVLYVGNDVGVYVSLDRGDTLSVSRTPDGITLRPADPEFDAQMEIARKVMRKYRNALRELAK